MNKINPNKLFPYFLFEISIVILVTVEAVLILAVLFPPAVGREIDFSAQYQPRPEWYFLSLYQLTKYFPGRWTFIGAVVLPVICFTLLLAAPFLDTRAERSFRERKLAVLIGSILFGAIVVLTILSLR